MRERKSRKLINFLFFPNLIVFLIVAVAICFPCSLALAADTTPPSAPSNLIAVQGSGTTIDLSWTAATDPESGIDHYIVYRYSAAIDSDNKSHADILSNTVTGITYNDSVGIPGEEYYYAVTAVNGDDLEGDLSNSPYQTVPAGPNPHQNYSDTTGFCRHCHKTHGVPSGTNTLLRKSPEIDTCYVCHDGTGSVYNIQVTYQGLGAHDTQVSAPAISNVKCMSCHYPHGTGNDFMTRQSEESVCFNSGCHDNATHTRTTTILGWNIYNQFQLSSYHAVSGTTGDGLTGAKIECSSCHGPHTVKYSSTSLEKISNPDNTYNLANATGTGITILTDFCLKCHDSTLPTQTWGSTLTFVPYSITFPVVTSYPFFPGWDKSAYTSSGHYTTSGTKAYCNNCHHPHGSNNDRLTAYNYNNTSTYEEEKLCYACHGTTPASGTKNIQTQATKTYRHPIGDYAGRHSDIETSSGLGESNKHAECTDCHDPHDATSSDPLGSVGGVQKNGTTAVNPVSYRYEVCLKCHSNYNGGLTGHTNKSDEFNGATKNAWHPVANTGKNLGIRDGAFVQGTPWNPTAGDDTDYSASSENTSCSGSLNTSGILINYGCHGTNSYASTDAQGPHGSANVNILIANGHTLTGSPSSSDVCFKCHNWDTYYNDGYSGTSVNSRFEHAYHVRLGYNCTEACHQSVAHGSNLQHFMRSGYTHYSDGGNITTSTAGCSASAGCHMGTDYPRYYSNY